MKPVLVFYIDIGNLDPMDVRPYMEQVKGSIGDFDNEYHSVFLPVRNQNNKVECLSPIVFKGEVEAKKMRNKISAIKYDIDFMMDRMPFYSKNMLLTERI